MTCWLVRESASGRLDIPPRVELCISVACWTAHPVSVPRMACSSAATFFGNFALLAEVQRRESWRSGADRRSSMRLSARHAAAHRRERRANANQFQPGKWGARGSGIVGGQPFVRPRTVTVQAGGSSGAAPPVGGFEVGSVPIGWRFVKDAGGAKVARKRHATLAPGRVSRLSMWLHSKSRWEEAALAARIVQPHFCDGRRTSLALQSKLGVITREDYSWWTPPSGRERTKEFYT